MELFMPSGFLPLIYRQVQNTPSNPSTQNKTPPPAFQSSPGKHRLLFQAVKCEFKPDGGLAYCERPFTAFTVHARVECDSACHTGTHACASVNVIVSERGSCTLVRV